MFTKQNIPIIILAILLAASIISLILLSASYRNVKQSLQACQKTLSEQDQKVAQRAEAEMKQMQSTHDKLVSELKDQIKKQEVTIKESQESLSLNLVDRVLFEFGKADLTPEGEKVLNKVGEALKNITGKNPGDRTYR
jgi:chemotaxis protein MotB